LRSATISGPVGSRAQDIAKAFGLLVRSQRQAMNLSQDELALLTGVGRRFIIELEAGKPSCQLGRSLLVARELGLNLADTLRAGRLGAREQETDG
jgi:transcriptional regulator with XRE-family HTH domain